MPAGHRVEDLRAHRLRTEVAPDDVSTANALIEATAKCVITARGKSYSKAAKVPALVSAAQESLGLASKSVSDENRALRQALQSLVTLTQSVTEIRNCVGIDHGAEEVPKWVRPRHARLVVGLVPAHAGDARRSNRTFDGNRGHELRPARAAA